MSTSDEAPIDLLVVACPTCHGAAAATLGLVGRPVRCPLCAAGFVVPTPPMETSAPAAVRMEDSGGPVLADVVAEVRTADASAIPLVVRDEEAIVQRSKLAARDSRRARRNLILAVVGSVLLAALVYLLGSR